MPSSYFSEYLEYHALSPFGDERNNIHAAIIASVMANANRGKNTSPFKIDDFMIKSQYDKEKELVQSAMAFFKGLTNDG